MCIFDHVMLRHVIIVIFKSINWPTIYDLLYFQPSYCILPFTENKKKQKTKKTHLCSTVFTMPTTAMNHYLLQHSLCNVLQWCPGTEICVRHELPVHRCIQGNPAKLSQMTIRVWIRVWGGQRGRSTGRLQHLLTYRALYTGLVWMWTED